MTHVVTENCILCKHTDCVEVCPVDCFYAGENMLVIDPDECIDCGICIPECPVDAIVMDHEPGAADWLDLNRDHSKRWTNLIRKVDPLPDAEAWDGRPGKLAHFSTRPHDPQDIR